MKPSAFLGLRTVVYYVADLERAKALVSLACSASIRTSTSRSTSASTSAASSWGSTRPRATSAPGARRRGHVLGRAETWPRRGRACSGSAPPSSSEPQDVGGGIKVATVNDPFGNLLGMIENPHFPNTA